MEVGSQLSCFEKKASCIHIDGENMSNSYIGIYRKRSLANGYHHNDNVDNRFLNKYKKN
jgi:hypothetical protein